MIRIGTGRMFREWEETSKQQGPCPVSSLSQHARARMKQRAIRHMAVELAQQCGEEIQQNGATVYFLGHRRLPMGIPPKAVSRLAGTVVITQAGKVLTVFRCSKVPRRLRIRSSSSH